MSSIFQTAELPIFQLFEALLIQEKKSRQNFRGPSWSCTPRRTDAISTV